MWSLNKKTTPVTPRGEGRHIYPYLGCSLGARRRFSPVTPVSSTTSNLASHDLAAIWLKSDDQWNPTSKAVRFCFRILLIVIFCAISRLTRDQPDFNKWTRVKPPTYPKSLETSAYSLRRYWENQFTSSLYSNQIFYIFTGLQDDTARICNVWPSLCEYIYHSNILLFYAR